MVELFVASPHGKKISMVMNKIHTKRDDGFNLFTSCAICDFPRENEELQLEQELSRQSDSKIGTT
jgi:hypothetical protein